MTHTSVIAYYFYYYSYTGCILLFSLGKPPEIATLFSLIPSCTILLTPEAYSSSTEGNSDKDNYPHKSTKIRHVN